MYDKEKLKNLCVEILIAKINLLKDSIKEAQNSSNNDTKSTAGDKHETSRAMAQLEVERLSQQLQQQERTLTLLKSTITSPSKTIQNGSIVITNKGAFYLAIALGAVKFEDLNIMSIGMSAPISQLMITKSIGDSFTFNGNKYNIEQIF